MHSGVVQLVTSRASIQVYTARLQSIAQALAIPGNPLSYPFDKSMWSSLRAPYAARVWEAMAARGYELHSRLPGLRNDPR